VIREETAVPNDHAHRHFLRCHKNQLLAVSF
jgi:hypothetical protein